MTAHSDDPEALRLALVLLKHAAAGDRHLAVRLIRDLDSEWTARLLIAQTDNAARLFGALFLPPTTSLALRLGRDPQEFMAEHFDALILRLAAEETGQG